MSRWPWVAALSLLTAALAINRSVYKIVLTQKGFAQFVQYDLETPAIREFTFCTWIRVYDLENDQSIFTYIVNGNNRIVRLWLDSGGRYIKVSFRTEGSVGIPVDIVRDVWRHVCLSYQSDHGAWALYVDSRLVSCEATQALLGFVIPAGGSVIVGYGTSDSGAPNGLEGELFGVNMILASTIERNFTMKNHPQFIQKPFRRNKVRGPKNIDYVILKDLQTDEIANVVANVPPKSNKSNSVKTRLSNSVDHDIGIPMTSNKPKPAETSNEREILEIVMDHKSVNEKPAINFWNFVNAAGRTGKFKSLSTSRPDPSGAETQLTISEYETPPRLTAPTNDYYSQNNLEVQKLPVSESIFEINDLSTPPPKHNGPLVNLHTDEIYEVEVPPPPETDTNVYGQWTSSKYAGNVLNYLKSINFYTKEKKVPKTIPLTKVSDTYPYPSDLKPKIVRPPTNIQKKKMISEKTFQNHYLSPSTLKHLHIQKRHAKTPEVNVQIVENDLRNEILKLHAQTKPKHVEITSRGETKRRKSNKSHENTSLIENDREELLKIRRFIPYNNDDQATAFDFHKSNSLFNVLPFLKSVEYFTGEDDLESNKVVNVNDMYTKSFSNANKWHNIKYNYDYTARLASTSDENPTEIYHKNTAAKRQHPSIPLKYKPDTNKVVSENNDEAIVKGRELAIDVSNQSKNNKDAISILKYNHGYLPGHDRRSKTMNKDQRRPNPKFNRINGKNNFNKHVKIGNALNERQVIGINDEQNEKSFVGGDEKVPDIHKYRSEFDKETENVPSSLKLQACKNIDLLTTNAILYVQPDGSIDTTDKLSPLKAKNVGVEFVLQNYQKCSLEDSPLGRNHLLLINWSRTPVRIFGGATPRKTKDLCGFF